MIEPGIDHIALNVPAFDAQVDRLTRDFGLVIQSRLEHFAVLVDPATGLKLELGRSDDAQVHFRHFGFRTDDVDATHAQLVDSGMEASEPPQRRDFARMYTSFLEQPGVVDIQLVKYDSPA